MIILRRKTPMARYKKPDWATRNVLNPALGLLMRMGLSVRGSRVLAVRGRKSGEWRTTPANPLELDGRRYLVAPRGNTQWVRNVRAGGETELRLGGKRERIRPVELPDEEKAPILRGYLAKWKMEAGQFFDGVTAESPDDDVRRIAPNHPVFRIEPED
jgi:deazaflavin-dependent oxidoreductase (nitroreductase family)